MKKFVLLLLVILILPTVYGLSYSVSVSYDAGNFILRNVSLSGATGSVQTFQSGEYVARIMSYQDKVLYESTFNVAIDALFSIPLSKSTLSSALLIKKEGVDLVFPYYSNAKTLKILKNNVLLLEVDLSTFSICNENTICEGAESFRNCVTDCTCGNGFCEENYLSCSKDCSSGEQDGVCDTVSDGKCDLDCGSNEDTDCEEIVLEGVSFNYIYLGVGIFVIVVLGIIVFERFWKKQKGIIARKKK